MDFSKVRDVSREIDIRGLMVDEAEILLGKYIDDAILAGLNKIIVIHGKGTWPCKRGKDLFKAPSLCKDISIVN